VSSFIEICQTTEHTDVVVQTGQCVKWSFKWCKINENQNGLTQFSVGLSYKDWSKSVSQFRSCYMRTDGQRIWRTKYVLILETRLEQT